MARRIMLAVVVAGMAAGVGGVWAQGADAAAQPVAAQPAERIAPEAQRVLDRAKAHYTKLKSTSVQMSMAMKMGGMDQKQSLEMSLERPNRVAIQPGGAEAGMYKLYSDGTNLWQYMGGPMNKYTEEPSPGTFKGVLEATAQGQEMEPSMMFMAPHLLVMTMMEPEGFDSIWARAQKIEYIGRDEAEGWAADRIRVTNEDVSADLWFRVEGEAWLDRISPDMSKMFAAMGNGQKPEITIAMTEWVSRDAAPEGAFAFKVPEGAEKVKSLMEAMQGGGGEDPSAALVGSPAPEMKLDLLGGGSVDLASHKGKDVVVLDFWATWCGPCVKALPILSKVTDSFKDKGVVFYAVNQQEGADQVKAFLADKKLTLKVPMDAQGVVAQAYKVTGIPQTVLIGKDGTVQAVHVGFIPGLEKQLTDELAALVEGKALAAPEGNAEPKPKE